jgi:hypothetical protein
VGPDVGIPAGLAALADDLPGASLAAAIRASRVGHPSPSRFAVESHTGTSRGLAIRRRTNNNGGLPT